MTTMPTGYTHKLMEEGQSFPDFVMLCARAMGACIMLRDEPLNAPIPKFEPSDYSLKRHAEAMEEAARLEAMNQSQRNAYGEAARKMALDRYDNCEAESRDQSDRLAAMKGEVEAWTPPTPDHEGLKKFMLEQIQISDIGMGDFYKRQKATAEAKTAIAYFNEALAEQQRLIGYHEKEYAEEVARTSARNKWVEDLRSSLQLVPA